MPDPELEGLVQQLMEAGGTDDDLDELINSYDSQKNDVAAASERNKFVGDVYKGPDTFWGGVWNSVNPFGGGEALKAGVEGAKGYAKGATLDIPSSIAGMVGNTASFAGDVLSDPIGYGSKVAGAVTDPLAVGRGMAQGARSIGNSILSAGSDPEGFGRTTGQLTGQPAVMAGLSPHIPAAIRQTGKPVEWAGRMMQKHQPMSAAIPRLFEPRLTRILEKGAGSYVEDAGQAMQRYGAHSNIPPKLSAPANPNSFTPNPPTSTTTRLPQQTATTTKPPNPTPSSAHPTKLNTNGSGAGSNTKFTQQVLRPANAPMTGDPEIDAILEKFKLADKEVKVADEAIPELSNNASGESAASVEAMNRVKSMATRGEQYVVYDHAGNVRPLIGPDAVDFVPGRGETYGIQKADGTFIRLEDNGGKVTATRQVDPKRREYPGFQGTAKEYGVGHRPKGPKK